MHGLKVYILDAETAVYSFVQDHGLRATAATFVYSPNSVKHYVSQQ